MGKEQGSHNLQILHLASGQFEVLPESEGLFSPRWSPNGRWIAALSLNQNVLKVFDVEHRSWKTLFTSGVADPVWSSDSQSVYFHAFASPNSAILRAQVTGAISSIVKLPDLRAPELTTFFFGGIMPDGTPIIEPRVGTGNLYTLNLPTLQK